MWNQPKADAQAEAYKHGLGLNSPKAMRALSCMPWESHRQAHSGAASSMLDFKFKQWLIITFNVCS